MYKGYTELLVEQQSKLLLIKFNNPKKKNCVNRNAYVEIARVLRTASNDDRITVIALTGVGEFFTSGNDLTQQAQTNDFDAYIKESNDIFKNMVRAFIECPKLLICVVNGPCIGIGTTLAGLSDLVWCAETAYFATPFTKLGLVPEACSSYTFSLLIGRSKATEMLLLNEQMSAEEAYHFGFVSKVFKATDLETVIWPKIREYSELPSGSLLTSKHLLRMHERDILLKTLDIESVELLKRFYTEEFINAMLAFQMRKERSKL